jgi:hypothetical protein
MPNGAKGDDPFTDMLWHGCHPYPSEVETSIREILELMRQVEQLHPHYFNITRGSLEEYELWEKRIVDMRRGENLEQMRRALESLIKSLRASRDQ